jgi:hypothetical protein
VGITINELVALHPRLFHMAEEGTWESIRDSGLLSTSALLDRFEVHGDERKEIEERNRRISKTIHHPSYGSVVIRDQIPMTDKALKKCLEKLTPFEWYKTLNSRVFFWPTEDRLSRLFNAKAYRGKTQTILTIDTKSFLTEYGDRVLLSPINSGSTIMNPQPRGPQTFLSIEDYPFDEWRKKRSRAKAIAEITVNYSVPDIKKFVTSVVHMKDKQVVKKII